MSIKTPEISIHERARLVAEFKQIRVPHARLSRIEDEVLEVLAVSEALVAADEKRRASAVNESSFSWTELYVLPIVGPSGVTKTTSLEAVRDKVQKSRPNEIPILYVKLRTSTRTERLLQSQIFEAFGENGQAEIVRKMSGSYEAAVVNKAIRNTARAKRTGLVILDEVGNMLGAATSDILQRLAPAIRSLVNDGVFSVVLAGTDVTLRLLNFDSELNSRNYGTVRLDQADWRNPEDLKIFFRFVRRFEREMLDRGIIDRAIGLVDSVEARAIVFDFANGIVGAVARVLAIALRYALKHKRRHIEWDDISAAFWAWKQENPEEAQMAVHDPFSNKPRATTIDAVRKMPVGKAE